MPDLSMEMPCASLDEAFAAVVDREGKIPAALEELGPLIGQEVVVLDCGRGERARQLEEFGARVTAVEMPASETVLIELVRRLAELPEGGADAVVVFWSDLATPGSPFIADAMRLLRPGGRLLVVHDYGRDDVWRLRPDMLAERVAWSQRNGPFLGAGFRIRVIHCWWTFDTGEQARELLSEAFGEAGVELADRMKRPRLESNVAVYHRSAPAREMPVGSTLVRSPA
jgi:SAM-dependent methyltransferase